jgi:hypothetical protein
MWALMSLSRLRLLLAIALAMLVVAALAFQSTAAATLKYCGGGVRAEIVACWKAKRIAADYAKTRRRSVQGFKCTSGDRRARCVLDRKLVLFPAP